MMIKIVACVVLLGTCCATSTTAMALDAAAATASVEQWGEFEAVRNGAAAGGPFTEVELSAAFQQGGKVVSVTGFYDGDGIYGVRCRPATTGGCTYKTRSNRPRLDGNTSSCAVTAPSARNHGPARVRDPFRFDDAGPPYRGMGTTCYAWVHQSEELQEQTLQTPATAPFNKLWRCVFPKCYVFNPREPALCPFAGSTLETGDVSRFNPAIFQHFETRDANV